MNTLTRAQWVEFIFLGVVLGYFGSVAYDAIKALP